MEFLNKICSLDLVCRRMTGKSMPTELLCMIVKLSRVKIKKQKKVVRRDLDFIEKGSRVKRVKSKVRIKRAMRFY